MRILCISIAMLCIGSLFAQDNHYWSQQFGGRSNLLGGAVVAGVRDNAAAFYNPGAVAFIERANLSVSANVYRLSSVKTQNGAGQDLDLKSLRLSVFPQMISGLINFKKNPKWQGSYIVMTRHFGNEKVVFRHEMFYDVFLDAPGDEEFIGSLSYDSQVNEQWGGFAVSRRIGEHWSVGLTTFVSYRNQKYKLQASANTVVLAPPDVYVSSFRVDQDLVIDDFKVLWKAGVAYQNGGLKLGLTVTSPSAHIVGFANVGREESFLNRPSTDLITGAERFDIMATDRQKPLKDVDYKTPLSISAGIEYGWAKAKVMVSAEYFHNYGVYNIVTPEARAFVRPSTLPIDIGEDEFLAVAYPTKSVGNIGIGYEQDLGKKIMLHLGFRTDFSSFDTENAPTRSPDDLRIVLTPINFGLLHYTAGFTLKGRVSDLTFGLDYARGFGVDTEEPIARFDRPEYFYDVPVEPIGAETTANSFTIVLGFTYFFKRGEAAEE